MRAYICGEKIINVNIIEMANVENQVVKSKRDLFSERMSGRYPDKDFSDDEALFGQISDDYDDYDNKIKGYQAREKEILDMFNSDERSAAFLADWKKGQSPWTAFIRKFGKAGLEELVNNEEKQAEFEEAEKEYLANAAKSKELEAEREANIEATQAIVDEWEKKHGLESGTVDNLLAVASAIADDAFMGIVKEETLDMLLKAMNYEKDLAEAASEAEIRGKNAKIDEKLRTRKANDGTVALDGKTGTTMTPKRRNLGALDRFGGDGNKTIWERGNEKRTRYNS